MYIARFSYSVLPVNRQRAIDFIHREVEAAKRKKLASQERDTFSNTSKGAPGKANSKQSY